MTFHVMQTQFHSKYVISYHSFSSHPPFSSHPFSLPLSSPHPPPSSPLLLLSPLQEELVDYYYYWKKTNAGVTSRNTRRQRKMTHIRLSRTLLKPREVTPEREFSEYTHLHSLLFPSLLSPPLSPPPSPISLL